MILNWQIVHLDPQMEEDGTDVYPQPQSGMVERGSRVYAANGCIYCHSQQVRADYAADDIERKWGDRRSAPRDYIFERPIFLGKMRMGQDLSNIGARAPAEQENVPPAGAASPAAQGGAAAAPPAASVPPTGASRFAVSVSNRKCESWRDDLCVVRDASSGSTASADDRRTADVLRCVAACASLFAAQDQRRLEHAVLSFSLSNAPDQ